MQPGFFYGCAANANDITPGPEEMKTRGEIMIRNQNGAPWLVGLAVWLLFWSGTVLAAASDRAVEALLGAEQAPEGVVFEIASGDSTSLEWALPRIQRYVKVLRDRFPGLEIAVVSHGREQFSLTEDKRESAPKVHQDVQRLVRDDSVPVHVCETYAEWNGVGAEQFPDYVQVAAEGPAQVRAYQELGYTLIKLRRP